LAGNRKNVWWHILGGKIKNEDEHGSEMGKGKQVQCPCGFVYSENENTWMKGKLSKSVLLKGGIKAYHGAKTIIKTKKQNE